MDFSTLFKGNLTAMAENMTGGRGYAAGNNKMMESLLPMLGGQFNPVVRSLMLLYQMIGSNLGIDPTLILTLAGFFWAANRVIRQAYGAIFRLIQDNFMSSIHISSTDEIYTHMMKWLALQPLMASSRSLTAETVSKTAWEEEEELEALQTRTIAGSGSGATEFLNFSNQEAKAPPRYVPAVGVHGFWYKNRYFRLHRKQQSVFDGESNYGTFRKEEDLIVSCFGRNPLPIKDLLRFVKEFYYQDHYARTTIKRPSPAPMRRYGGRYNWSQVANRPVRPMRTVVLDPRQKAQVMADMNEYLHPATPRWYANRGIPLRRGYLFYGPPGTGKTSLSFALAGVFGLDIFVISLLEPTLTEEDLGTLFNSLPRRCVVLLEDIDTAGLARVEDEADGSGGGAAAAGGPNGTKESDDKSSNSKDNTKDENSKKASAATNKDDWKVSDLARALKKESKDDKKGISLSGLLNAIDGVASQEGRILVMTTNKPESLDEALIRPGRVDLQVGFTNATPAQATELFQRMYEADGASPAKRVDGHVAPPTNPKPSIVVNGSGNGSAGSSSSATPLSASASSTPSATQSSFPPSTENPSSSSSSSSPQAEAAATTAEKKRHDFDGEELSRIADEFGALIPDGLFSPAEIQGFLLKRKKDPRRALRETAAWVEGMRQQKENKTKVLRVQ
ncbi:BCS1 N terminal-domain-containing protein [Colletotrichum godetiae]|uniref:BCS1 N terminal-domain-containing protein n=1 Tax=Colletotrichum godetiae TaxID=1209918 RepID=A0AAJ0EXN9_9PEZI|nr:BCS1 N terminal-domain-containing protein [Colletotrichum godetiae]KAK1687851.1 BCS1 N terminal-domain-containing protein [Colletotrichum godetiae]